MYDHACSKETCKVVTLCWLEIIPSGDSKKRKHRDIEVQRKEKTLCLDASVFYLRSNISLQPFSLNLLLPAMRLLMKP